MKPPPAGWPRMAQSIYYDDPAAAIDWLCEAFGFEVRLKVEGDAGDIVHSELTYGEGMVMVGGSGRKDTGKETWQARQISPKSVQGNNTQSICIFVDDVDAHCAQALKHGAKVHREPKTDDYGDDYWSDRTYGATDPEGHMWWFMQRISTGKKPG
jgi:uncharacterized glyoxalase superfamily protein PhnB